MNQGEANTAINAAFNANGVNAHFVLEQAGNGQFNVIIRYGSPDAKRGAMLAKQVLGAQFHEWRLSRPT